MPLSVSHTRTILSLEPVIIHRLLPGKNLTELTAACGLRQDEIKRRQKSRTVCPEYTRISGKLCGSEPDPSEVISQHLTVPSLHPLINLLPSPVNSIHLTPCVCPDHFATSFRLRESHIQSELFKSPPAMYRPSGLNATERNLLVLPVTDKTFDDPSRKFHMRTDASSDPETRERPSGGKAMLPIELMWFLNTARIRLRAISHI